VRLPRRRGKYNTACSGEEVEEEEGIGPELWFFGNCK